MRITTVSRLAGTTLALGILLIVGGGWLALQELRVNGPIYQRIAAGKDLIANVVPPSAYIIEAFLEATVILKEPWTLEPGRKRLNALRAEYEERHAFWSKQELPRPLQSQLLKASHEPAKHFWQVVENSFLPALDKGNAEAAGDAYLQLTDDFRAHRAAVDEVVKLAREMNSELESSSARREHMILGTIGLFASIVIALVVACMLGASSWIVGSILRMQDAMRRLAGGDLNAPIGNFNRVREVLTEICAINTELLRRREELD